MKKFFVYDTKCSHFRPTFLWPKKYETTEIPHRTVLDKTSELLFLNDPRELVHIKCILLSIFVPIFHGALSVLQILFSIGKLGLDIKRTIIEGPTKFYDNLHNVLKDLIKIILAPLLVIILELTAIVGMILPLNARKIFGSIERLMVNEFEVHKFWNSRYINNDKFQEGNKAVLAPCFQPHMFYDDSLETDNFPDMDNAIEMINMSS